jgi:LDH2 family malate/lactate/ureidoglycolate dehydrogenase
LKTNTLREVMEAILAATGTPADLARQVADVLVDNSLAGHDSHGLLRLPEYVRSIQRREIVPAARPAILKETAASALIGGNWAFGQVTGLFAIDTAVDKAKREGVSVVAVVEANHTGRLAAFTERAARQDVVVFMAIGTVDVPMTAPFGGAKPVLGTNPIAFSIPGSSEFPMTVDISCSAVAAGKIKVAKAQHQQLPPGSILDRNGTPTTDPQAFFDGGFLLPFAGHKGYALAMAAELLSGALVGSEKYPGVFQRSGIFLFAVNAGLFRPLSEFQQAVTETLARVKAVPPQPGFDEVLIPGEPEYRTRLTRERDGIPIAPDTWRAVCEISEPLGVDVRAIAGTDPQFSE